MKAATRERARQRIEEIARQGHDVTTLWQETSELLAPAVPFFRGACYYTLDPTSLLMTSHYNEAMPELPPEWVAMEYYEDGVNRLVDIARSAPGYSTLHEATGGDPTGDPRWHANMSVGGDQEFITVLRTSSREVWGAVGLYREPGEPMFDEDEIGLLGDIAPALAAATRHGLLIGEASDPDGPDAPGLLVLSARWEVESSTPGTERWIADLPDGDWGAGRLPSCVLAVAGQALRNAGGQGGVAVARVLSGSGTWVVLHGAALTGGGRRVAVIIEPAHPARITPLLMSAFGLTSREQEVTRLVLKGESTAEIAAGLVVSPHTVQQHLKTIFEKTGVRSRRDLVGKVFFKYYEPRLRDNERRVPLSKPVRGGPMSAAASRPSEPAG